MATEDETTAEEEAIDEKVDEEETSAEEDVDEGEASVDEEADEDGDATVDADGDAATANQSDEEICDRLGALSEGRSIRVTTDFGDEGPRAGETDEFEATVDRATTDALGVSQALLTDGDDEYRLAQNYTSNRVSATRLTAGNDKVFLGVVTGIYDA